MRYQAFLAFDLFFILFYFSQILSQFHRETQVASAPKKKWDWHTSALATTHTVNLMSVPKTHACTTRLASHRSSIASFCSLLPLPRKKLIGGVRRNTSSFSVGNNRIPEPSCHAVKLDSAWVYVCAWCIPTLFTEKSLIPGGPRAKSIRILWWAGSIGRSKG